MKLTRNSKNLMLFLKENNFVTNMDLSKSTESILLVLYNDLYNSYLYLNKLKENKNYFHQTFKIINLPSQIPMPQNFNSNSFPLLIRLHIEKSSMYLLTFYLHLFNRKIKIHFIIEEKKENLNLDIYQKYLDAIIMWLYILNEYSSKLCANSLTIYFYFTSLKKKLPESNIDILDEINVNTAFTSTCPKDSEIVVFRKEEWFKVFIHETFHNFGLDFSDMNNTDIHNCILDIFKVDSNVNLYESYTEIWAEIMNILFCSFYALKEKQNIQEFIIYFHYFINYEISFSIFQLIKTLDFMGLKYKDLFENKKSSILLRENFYKEKTNVLSYYVIKTILIYNYQGFLSWCKKNNFSLLQFNKTIMNQREFCHFIENKYKISKFLNEINNTEKLIYKVKKKDKKNLPFILNNLRMSICELD